MKKIFTLLIALLALTNANSQLALSNFNSSGMNGWIMINDANNPDPATWNATFVSKWQSSAFIKYAVGAGDSALIACAVFSPKAAPDRWLISPSFQVNSTNCFLLFDYLGNGGVTSTEEFEILVSTNAGTNKSDFTLLTSLSGTSSAKTMAAGLGTYNGQTIRVAIRYKSSNGYLAFVDNIRTKILAPNDAAMVSVTPSLNSLTAYGLVGSQINISGVVYNLGASAVTSYTVYYQVGTSAPVSQTFQPFFFSSYSTDNFSFSTPYTISSVGAKDIKVWVSISGDTTMSNDTLKTKVTGVTYMPKKKVTFEEGTGTWCGWCPRGAVYTDSFTESGLAGTVIAVHNADTMTVKKYDSLLTLTPGFSGFPGLVIDRRAFDDPSSIFDYYNSFSGLFGFAEMKRTIPTINNSLVSTTVTVRPATNLNGVYRLALVISEDNIKSTHSKFDQKNYYSSSSNNQNLIYKGVNWKNLPNPVPASQMTYNHVARAIYPAYSGDATSALPASMNAGQDYTITLSGAMSSSWNTNNLHYNVLLIDGTTGYVLNSINDTGYIAPKSANGSDTFHKKVYSVSQASSTSGEIIGAPSLTQGTNYSWKINKANVVIPSGWSVATVCDPKNCYTYKDNIQDTFNGRAINEFNVAINHNKIQGYGYLMLGVWKTGDSVNTYKAYKFSMLTTNSASVTILTNADDKLLYYFDNKVFIDREFRNGQIEIYDINGKQLVNQKITSDMIDFTSKVNGIYIARVLVGGQVAKSLKFSVEK